MAASTYNFTDGTIDGQMIPPEITLDTDSYYIRRNIVDLSKQSLDAGEGDIARVLNIPAGTIVWRAWIRIITAETANGTCDLGYGSDVDKWGDALALDTAAGGVLGGLDVPVYFSAADTIDIVATTDTADVDLDGAKFEVYALCTKVQDAY